VIILINDEQSNIVKTGKSGDFTAEQLDFLQSLDYSTNLMIWADYREKNVTTGKMEDHHWTPYLTIVPEKQAEYESGKESLMTYLKENSKNSRASVDPDNLQPAKLYFTVTKEGAIKNVRLDRSSNYPSVDERMIELITNAPGKWKPAENSEGEKVDQELVISFGLMGC
ncbi:MAG: energy transducer TonB, partial [Bacteroidia bacterium]|nr:energy transducer TonB [Bacteroidia bacterium]